MLLFSVTRLMILAIFPIAIATSVATSDKIENAHPNEKYQNIVELLESGMGKYMSNAMDSQKDDLIPDLERRLKELPDEYKIAAGKNVSPECRRHYNQLTLDRLLGRIYAWQFSDSDGKLPPGVTDVNLNWLGSFDVCGSATKRDNDGNEVFHGLYCLSYTQFIAMIGLRIGRCLPSSCSEEDAYNILSEDFFWNISSIACAKQKPFSAGDWTTLIITAIFFCLVISATIVDATLRICNKETHLDQSSHFFSQSKNNNKNNNSSSEHIIKPENMKRSKMSTGSFLNRLLLSFSVGRTFPKILSSKTTYSELQPMAGFIVLSVTYVILYNTSTTITYFTGNILSAFQKQRDLVSLVVANGSTCFDSLFTISGILVAYISLKQMDSHNGSFQWLKYYGYRLWRVLPIYTLALMWYATLIRHIAYGPFSVEAFTRSDVVACHQYWWTNILFINNFVPGRISNQCMESSWYIANDMQFFLLSPFLIILLHKRQKIAFFFMALLLAMCLIVRGIIAFKYEIQPLIYSIPTNPSVSDHFYLRPYYRIAPYLTGLFTGYLMWKTDCRVNMKWWLALIGWIAAFGTGFTVVYGLIGYFKDLTYLPLEVLAVYQSVNRWAWSLAVAWSVFACCTGNGGPITMVFGWSGFIPIVRLGFVFYLTHLHMVQTYLHSLMQPMPYTPYVVMYMYVGHIFLGIMLSLVCSSVIETPLNSIGKLIFRRIRQAYLPDAPSKASSDITISSQNTDIDCNYEIYVTNESLTKVDDCVFHNSKNSSMQYRL